MEIQRRFTNLAVVVRLFAVLHTHGYHVEHDEDHDGHIKLLVHGEIKDGRLTFQLERFKSKIRLGDCVEDRE